MGPVETIYYEFAKNYLLLLVSRQNLNLNSRSVREELESLEFIDKLTDAAIGDFFTDEDAQEAIDGLEGVAGSSGYDEPSQDTFSDEEYAPLELFAHARWLINQYYTVQFPIMLTYYSLLGPDGLSREQQ